MKIALLGFGKMGQLIKSIAIEKGHTIDAIFDANNKVEKISLPKVDVAIDFSTPSSAYHNISTVLNQGIPVVSGTTGWLDKINRVNDLAISNDTAFLYASNFSIGVNLFFELNRKLNQLMKLHTEYKVHINEIHHTEKIDAPSGTALTLKSDLNDSVNIKSERIENVPGTHCINYDSEIDSISISHVAHNRKGFAIGAVMAAEYIKNKKGIYSMSDVLKI